MSCFLVDKAHIDALVAAACRPHYSCECGAVIDGDTLEVHQCPPQPPTERGR